MKHILLVVLGIVLGAGAVVAWQSWQTGSESSDSRPASIQPTSGSPSDSVRRGDRTRRRRQPSDRRQSRRERQPPPEQSNTPEDSRGDRQPAPTSRVRTEEGVIETRNPARDRSAGSRMVRVGDEVIWTRKVPEKKKEESEETDDIERIEEKRSNFPSALDELLSPLQGGTDVPSGGDETSPQRVDPSDRRLRDRPR